MTVVAGFPWKFAISILSVCACTLAKELLALVFRTIPTPPVATPARFTCWSCDEGHQEYFHIWLVHRVKHGVLVLPALQCRIRWDLKQLSTSQLLFSPDIQGWYLYCCLTGNKVFPPAGTIFRLVPSRWIQGEDVMWLLQIDVCARRCYICRDFNPGVVYFRHHRFTFAYNTASACPSVWFNSGFPSLLRAPSVPQAARPRLSSQYRLGIASKAAWRCGLSCKQSGDYGQVGWWNCHLYIQLDR